MSLAEISVAIATCQGAQFLAAQLATIYAQTLPPAEVVVSDDASTDGTAEILARFARQRGLRYEVNSERLGLVGNFARALALCRSPWIALADQDDLWKPHKLARLAAATEPSDPDDPVQLVYSDPCETLEPDGTVRYAAEHAAVVNFARRRGTGRPVRELLAENWVVSHTMLLRREAALAALPFPAGLRYHDGWLALAAASRGPVRFVDECLETYRRHAASLTFQTAPAQARRWSEIVSATFRSSWQERCASEAGRLRAALSLAGLTRRERAFGIRLLRYYQCGLEPGWRWRSALAGLGLGRFFSTAGPLSRRLRFPLRALLGGR